LIRDPLGRETRFEFDSLGRQVKRKLPLNFGIDGKSDTSDDASAETFSEISTYDKRGRIETRTSFEGVTTTNIYVDKTGRLDEERFSITTTPPSAPVPAERRKFTYDDYGRVSRIEYLLGDANDGSNIVRAETTSYSADGKVLLQTTPEGNIQYSYDKVDGSLTKKEYSSSAFMATATSFETTTFYSYDTLGRLRTVTQQDQGGTTLAEPDVKEYRYDLVGNLDQTRFKNGIIQDNDYDSLNRLEIVRHWQDLNNNGLFDPSELRAEFDYELRPDGKRSKVKELIKEEGANGTVFAENTFDWSYDEVDRLVAEILTSSKASTPSYSLNWTYDLAGNRLSQVQTKSITNPPPGGSTSSTETTTYVVDANDRLRVSTMVRTGAYANSPPELITLKYDYNKTQQASKSTFQQGSTSPTNVQAFAYDMQGLLREVVTTKFTGSIANSKSKVVYGYDSSGTRISSSAYSAVALLPDVVYSLQSVTEYLTDALNHTGYSQVLQETEYTVTTNSNISTRLATKKTVYAIGLDQISQTIFQFLTVLPATTPDWVLTSRATFGTDGHGSVRVLYDTVGAILKDAQQLAQVYTYDAYGNLQGFNNLQPLTSYLYSGESFDFRIGQQYLRARFYDATTGRFNRLDPFAGNSSDPQSFHKYAYVHGDPVQGTDPTGMFLASSIGIVYNSVVMSVGDQMATDLFGLEVGLDPSTMMLSKMLEVLGVAVQWVGSQLSRGLPVIEAGMFLESSSDGASPTITEDDAVNYARSPLFLAESASSNSPSGNTGGAAAAARLGGLPGTVGAVGQFLRTAGKLAKYPVNLIARTGRRKVYVGSYDQLEKFNRTFGINGQIWQRHHLNQNAVFEKLGIPKLQGLSVNLKGAVTDGFGHAKFHKSMELFWDRFRDSGLRPTVDQYNGQLKKSLVDAGFSGDEAAEMTSLAIKQQKAYNIFGQATLLFLPSRTPAN
jgi:RHS repeat-associated protein